MTVHHIEDVHKEILYFKPYLLHHDHYVVNFNGWQGAVATVRKEVICQLK